MSNPNEVKDGDYVKYINELLKSSSMRINQPKAGNPQDQSTLSLYQEYQKSQAEKPKKTQQNYTYTQPKKQQNNSKKQAQPKSQNTFTPKNINTTTQNPNLSDLKRLKSREYGIVIPSIFVLIVSYVLLSQQNQDSIWGLAFCLVFALIHLIRYLQAKLTSVNPQIPKIRGEILSLFIMMVIVIICISGQVGNVFNFVMYILHNLGLLIR